MFRPGTLAYVATLPKPLPMVSSALPNSFKASNAAEKKGNIVYPMQLALVFVSACTCTVAYSDRSIIVWDIASGRNGNGDRAFADPKKSKVHRAFQFHSDCIWDVLVPGSTPDRMVRDILEKTSDNGSSVSDSPGSSMLDLPADTFFTCGADNTIRVWNLALAQTDAKLHGHSVAMGTTSGEIGPCQEHQSGTNLVDHMAAILCKPFPLRLTVLRLEWLQLQHRQKSCPNQGLQCAQQSL